MPHAKQRPTTPYPSPVSVAVDVVLISPHDGALYTVFVRRTEAPYAGKRALPGVLVGSRESLEAAAIRALETKTHLRDVYLEQLYTFGHPARDPRSRTIAVAYVALVAYERFRELATRRDVSVARIDDTASLAFDHADILRVAVERLRGKLEYTPVGYALLPDAFTLGDLQRVHETVLGRALNKDSFRRRMLASDDLEPTGEQKTGVDHRPAMLYRRRKAYTSHG